MTTQLPHKSFISRAQKIHEDILNVYNETVKSIDKLKSESPADQLNFLRIANVFADDLNKVIYELVKVNLKIDKSKHVHHSLQHIIDTLSDLTTAIRKSFHHGYEKVKIELKDSIKAATLVAEQLLAIIHSDDVIDHKEELLNGQSDVLFAVDRLRLSNLTKYLNLKELADVVHEPINTMKAIFSSLDPNQPNIKQKFIQYANHTLYKHQGCVEHIQKAASTHHFNDEIKNLLLETATDIHRYIVDMQKAFLKDSQFDQLIADCHQVVVDVFACIVKIFTLLHGKENAKISDVAKDFIFNLYGYSVGCVYQLMRILKYVESDE